MAANGVKRARKRRLREAVRAYGSVSGFIEAMRERDVYGSSSSSVHRFLSEDSDSAPSVGFLTVAARILGVPEEWLIDGKGAMTEAEAVEIAHPFPSKQMFFTLSPSSST